MPETKVARFLLLPELKIRGMYKVKPSHSRIHVHKESQFEICPRCATPSSVIYDRRWVKVMDAPVRSTQIELRINKRRLYCKKCRKPFTEPVGGIKKGQRTTQRYRREVLWAAENFSDLKRVQRNYRCSSGFIYKALYEQLKLRVSHRINYPWPKTIGIDEHFFTRRKGFAEFATVVTDFNNKRLREVVHGKTKYDLFEKLSHIEGRTNVANVALDLSDTYKSFAKEFFPNAKLIADKFHVLRLLSPSINKRRTAITGDKRTNPIRRMLLKNRRRLRYFERGALDRWLALYPELRELYEAKEALSRFYRIKGIGHASRILTKITDAMALSKLPEIKRLRRTLMKWRSEILNYFENRITNARTEGFNNVAKLVQKRAYGYKNFENYRLRLLNACA